MSDHGGGEGSVLTSRRALLLWIRRLSRIRNTIMLLWAVYVLISVTLWLSGSSTLPPTFSAMVQLAFLGGFVATVMEIINLNMVLAIRDMAGADEPDNVTAMPSSTTVAAMRRLASQVTRAD